MAQVGHWLTVINIWLQTEARDMRSQVVRANFPFLNFFFVCFLLSSLSLFLAFFFCPWLWLLMPLPISEAEKLVRGPKREFLQKKKNMSTPKLKQSDVAGRKWILRNPRSRCCTAASFSTDREKHSTVLLNAILLETVKQMGRHLPDMKLYMVKWLLSRKSPVLGRV